MKNFTFCWGIALLFFFGLTPQKSLGWGVWGHEHINRAAVFALPKPLRTFYFDHIDFITMDASVPDLRKHLLSLNRESTRHYFDTENYGPDAFTEVPEKWKNAAEKYGKAKLYRNGILPWYLQLIVQKLTRAFKEKNKTEILLLSSDLAHYVGDGYQPLHTTKNYDGQLSNQKGIHSLFESKLPEMFGCHYNWQTRDAQYVSDVTKKSWAIIRESHALVPKVFAAEKTAIVEEYGNAQIGHKPHFTKEFCTQFNKNLNGMIEQQLQQAVYTTASLWYTAWVNAGKPDLSKLDSDYTHKINHKPLRQQYRAWKKHGRLMGIKPN